MTNPYVNTDSLLAINLHEGWLDHKYHHESKWKRIWFVLKGNTLYFYTTQNTSETPNDALCIEQQFKFEKKVGSDKSGYRFDLHTNKRHNKFRAARFSEREQWKAYLEGIANGEVSDSIDLPPDSLNQIRLSLNQLVFGQESGDSISTLLQRNSMEFPINMSIHVSSVDNDSGCVDDYVEPAIPRTQSYVFHSDPYRIDLPSWFFPNCSRGRAEEILNKGAQYGNTLMRKGPTTESNLVISKKMENKREEYTHYRVVVYPEGYMLEVENPHQPMKTLTDVMNFFVETSSPFSTKPMTCNHLPRFGILQENDYNPVIISSTVPVETPYCHYKNIKEKAQAWSSNRTSSAPDFSPVLKILHGVTRRMSSDFVKTEADEPNKSTTPVLRPVNPSPSPPPPPMSSPPPLPSNSKNRSRVIPPPPPTTQDVMSIPIAPPPPPMNSHPPQTTILKSRFKVQMPLKDDETSSSSSPPLCHPPPVPINSKHKTTSRSTAQVDGDIAPPPPPVNNRVPLKIALSRSNLAQTRSAASSTSSHNSGPPVAPRPDKNIVNVDRDANSVANNEASGKKVGDVGAEEFKKKLEMMFVGGGNQAKTMPAIRPMKNLVSSHPSMNSVATFEQQNTTATTDDLYDSIESYQNSTAIRRNMFMK